ncbi:Serine/threonine-protein kinase US3-like [Lachnellula cervina]|uniref:Serine/threonine-protein kinase US3-like n=1 Tax=Lachnellula cervina TaxID=1316786 RepID=A0A7D8UU35_9HELO|nr:Serine/threonine-protein kinase US3-like [Lachnellula cervina]
MAASIKIGQRLEGKVGSYFVSAQVAKDIWTATSTFTWLTTARKSNSQDGKFIIKTAPQGRLENERDVLRHLRTRPCIRQMLDETESPPSLILQHLDDNLLHASNVKTLESSDVKLVAKRVLEAIQALHEDGYTHTDIKSDNILVNYGTGSSRFADVQLADFGDVTRIDPKDYLKVGMDGPHMGAPIFRSPEAMMQLRWGPSTDIWSFGTTVGDIKQLISLIWGLNWHMFKPDPKDATADDEEYLIHIIIRQLAHFGPVPKSYIDLIPREDSDRWTILGTATLYIKDNEKQRPFKIIEDDCLTEEDREFLLKVMKWDPRDRPTARQLLQDKWFSGVP